MYDEAVTYGMMESGAAGNADGLFGALAGMLMIFYAVMLVISIVQIIAMWKIFQKAGRPG